MKSAEIKARVFDAVERNRNELTACLRELVRIPSLTGEEWDAQKYVAQKFRDIGLEVDIFEPDYDVVSKHPQYVEFKWRYDGRPNVVGKLGGDPSAKSLILNGHVDVVSPEPVKAWKHSPWGGEIVDGLLHGRGSYDMKAGLVANIFAVKSILDAGVKPKGTLLLESVIEEEAGGGGGTLACFLKGYRADAMIITEPTDLRLGLASAGVLYFRVKVLGQPAHAGSAHLGVNAIGKMNRIYDALLELDKHRAENVKYPLFERFQGRSCHLNVGTYRAGDWPSTVAGWAEMECRISFVYGEKMEDIKREVVKTIESVASADEWLVEHPPEITWFGWRAEPWEQDASHPFVQQFKANSEHLLQKRVETVGLPAGTDARFGQYFGVPVVLFGPEGGKAHGVDEYVDIDSVVKLTKVLTSVVLDWCGYETQ